MSEHHPVYWPLPTTAHYLGREWAVLWWQGRAACLGIGKVFERKDGPPVAEETTYARWWGEELGWRDLDFDVRNVSGVPVVRS